MTTSSSHHFSGSRRRRAIVVVAVATMVIGAPFVVLALDGAENERKTGASVVVSDPPDEPASNVDPVDGEPDAEPVFEPAAETQTDTQEIAAPAPSSTVVEEPAADEASADDPPLDVHALLTNAYVWDERSLRVAGLQIVLNVAVDGWYSPDTRNTHLQFLEYIGFPVDGVPEPPPPGPSAEQWAGLRECESGGDYSIVSSSGRYRGAYQFARTTWDSVAERNNPALVGVDPATAAPADQDMMAVALYREAGAGPWPVCGRHLR